MTEIPYTRDGYFLVSLRDDPHLDEDAVCTFCTQSPIRNMGDPTVELEVAEPWRRKNGHGLLPDEH